MTAASFAVVLVLFFRSGCAALVYEIVSLQLLEFVIGSTGVSLGLLLGTFMGGLCLGGARYVIYVYSQAVRIGMGDAWVDATRQRWKVRLFWAGVSGSAVLFIAFLMSVGEVAPPDPMLGVGFATMMIISLVWLFVSIKCLRCGGRPAWWLVRRAPFDQWLRKLVQMRTCPICGKQ